MTMSATSLGRSKARSFGLASILALVGVMVAPIPGCLDETGSSPSGAGGGNAGCAEGDEKELSSGDCVKERCVSGSYQEVADGDDMPDDGNECTDDACNGTTPAFTNKASGADCGMGSKCDGMGACKCMAAADCGMDNECRTWECASTGTCSSTNAAQGTALMGMQTAGDCKVWQCNGMGGVEEVATIDPEDDANSCTVDACNPNGTTTHTEAQVGSPCAKSDAPGGDGKCIAGNPGLQCVDCVNANECGNGGEWNCHQNTCYSCKDNTTNGNETGTDCGGDCTWCPNGEGCLGPADCLSGICDDASKTCVSCDDGAQNGNETGVDCGGPDCKKCVGEACVANGDCAIDRCRDGFCCANACTGTCKTCGMTGSEGQCVDVAFMVEDTNATTTCMGTSACDGAGSCLLKNGQPCGGDGDCLSNDCAGGPKSCQP